MFRYFVWSLAAGQLSTASRWFSLLDADRNGALSGGELQAAMDTYGDVRSYLTRLAEVKDSEPAWTRTPCPVAAAMDADEDGAVGRAEFLAFFQDRGLLEESAEGDVVGAVRSALKKAMSHFPGLTSVEEVLAWTKDTAAPYVGPPGKQPVLPDRPRVMSIHDMAGNYGRMADNLYLQLFQSWSAVDVFVYFSHLRLAVPPQAWVAASHANDALALGTLMLEPGSGHAASERIQADQDTFIEKVAAITEHYGFDGWLLNLEAWQGSAQSQADFVTAFTAKMHKTVPGSHVVAYPSGPGDALFDAADGGYVQYGWDKRAASMEAVRSAAGGKAHDTYMGLDAFGSRRGNPTPDHDHVAACSAHDLSVAVFAPGYVLEALHGGEYSAAAERDDKQFWADIEAAFRPTARSEQVTAEARRIPLEITQDGRPAAITQAGPAETPDGSQAKPSQETLALQQQVSGLRAQLKAETAALEKAQANALPRFSNVCLFLIALLFIVGVYPRMEARTEKDKKGAV